MSEILHEIYLPFTKEQLREHFAPVGIASTDLEMAGRFSLKPASSYGLTGGTELGYRLYPAFWGRGLATEGALALIELAFEQLHLDRVVATMMADNTGSRRVMEKCGLRRISTFHYPDAHLMPGGEHGDVVYEVTRRDWTAQVKSKS